MTEWCVRVASTLLWDAFDMWRLWFLLTPLITLMGHLDYTIPLGGKDSNREVHALLQKITEADWDSVPSANDPREKRRPRHSIVPGRNHPTAGDFVWFSPVTLTF